VLVISIHQLSPPDRKIWSQAAVAFATIYTVLISINYYVQLTWVMPRLAAGRIQGIEQFIFTPFDSFLYSVDILGYSFMSVATLFAAMVFTGKGLERVVRVFLIANGLLLPFIARALGCDIPGIDVVTGYPFSTDRDDRDRLAVAYARHSAVTRRRHASDNIIQRTAPCATAGTWL
jgi:hypothetical protein